MVKEIIGFLFSVAWNFKGIILLRALAFLLLGFALFQDLHPIRSLDISFAFQAVLLLKYSDKKEDLKKANISFEKTLNFYGLLALFVVFKMVYLNSL